MSKFLTKKTAGFGLALVASVLTAKEALNVVRNIESVRIERAVRTADEVFNASIVKTGDGVYRAIPNDAKQNPPARILVDILKHVQPTNSKVVTYADMARLAAGSMRPQNELAKALRDEEKRITVLLPKYKPS